MLVNDRTSIACARVAVPEPINAITIAASALASVVLTAWTRHQGTPPRKLSDELSLRRRCPAWRKSCQLDNTADRSSGQRSVLNHPQDPPSDVRLLLVPIGMGAASGHRPWSRWVRFPHPWLHGTRPRRAATHRPGDPLSQQGGRLLAIGVDLDNASGRRRLVAGCAGRPAPAARRQPSEARIVIKMMQHLCQQR